MVLISRCMVLRETSDIRSSRIPDLRETYSTNASGLMLLPPLNLFRMRAILFNGNNLAIIRQKPENQLVFKIIRH